MDSSTFTHAAGQTLLAKRILAYLIDAAAVGIAAAIAGFFWPVVGSLLTAVYMLLRDGLDHRFMDGRSFGKQVVGLRVHRRDGLAMDVETSVRRNWMLALGSLTPALAWFWGLTGLISFAACLLFLYEAYRLFVGRDRWGDELAGTYVTEDEAR